MLFVVSKCQILVFKSNKWICFQKYFFQDIHDNTQKITNFFRYIQFESFSIYLVHMGQKKIYLNDIRKYRVQNLYYPKIEFFSGCDSNGYLFITTGMYYLRV